MPLHVSDRWSKFCDGFLDEDSTISRIPLPGEYIVVEMHPSSLIRNTNGLDVPSKCQEELLGYPFRKYCAVVYKYLDTLSPSEADPHTCLLLVLCSTGGSSSVRVGDILTSGPSPQSCNWIVVPARLFARPEMPSREDVAKPSRISPEALEAIYGKAISKGEGGVVLCRGGATSGGPKTTKTTGADPSSDSDSDDTDGWTQAENEEVDRQRHWLLWPHLTFDLDARQTVCNGRHLLAEQSSIIRMLDDYWIKVPQLTGFVARAAPREHAQHGLSLEGIRYRHHYMQDKESHIVVISADRMASRSYTALFVPDYTMTSSRKLHAFVRSLSSGHRPQFKRNRGIVDFIDSFTDFEDYRGPLVGPAL